VHEASVPSGNSLRSWYGVIFFADILLEEPQVAQYVSDVLADFAHVDSLYRIRNVFGRRLEDVGEMLVESNPAWRRAHSIESVPCASTWAITRCS
jgi:hypothetical protein